MLEFWWFWFRHRWFFIYSWWHFQHISQLGLFLLSLLKGKALWWLPEVAFSLWRKYITIFRLNHYALLLWVVVGQLTIDAFHLFRVVSTEAKRVFLYSWYSGMFDDYIRVIDLITAESEMWYVMIEHDSWLIGCTPAAALIAFSILSHLATQIWYHQIFLLNNFL